MRDRILAGLSRRTYRARYLFRMPKLGGALLVGVPVVDLILVVACVIDLATGGQAGAIHSLAAVYLGVSIAFGPYFVRRADVWFAHRFAGVAAQVLPKYGRARQRHEWMLWLRCLIALAISSALTGITFVVSKGEALAIWSFEIQLGLVTVIWLIGWPLRMTLFPPRPTA